MQKEKKSEKYNKIIELILQGVSTSEIAKTTGYSIGYIHNILEELRLEYGVNTKVGIAAHYLADKVYDVSEKINDILSIIGGCKIAPSEKRRRGLQEKPKRRKK